MARRFAAISSSVAVGAIDMAAGSTGRRRRMPQNRNDEQDRYGDE
jgi:hypothetical protein